MSGPASVAAGILERAKNRCCQCRPPDWQMMRIDGSWMYVEVCRTCGKPAPVASEDPRIKARWEADGALIYISPERKAALAAIPKTRQVHVKLFMDPEWGLKVIAELDKDTCDTMGRAFPCGKIVTITCEMPPEEPRP